MLRVRLTQREKEMLEAEARRKGVSMSEIVQDYIKTLPPATNEYWSRISHKS